jgi:hypothetical protein
MPVFNEKCALQKVCTIILHRCGRQRAAHPQTTDVQKVDFWPPLGVEIQTGTRMPLGEKKTELFNLSIGFNVLIG